MYGSITSLSELYWFDDSEKKKNFNDLYKLVGKLGEGYTATVYKCTEKGTDTSWAVKKIKKSYDLHWRARRKEPVLAEIGILLKIRHPNVIRLKEVYETTNLIYLVLELVTGGELLDRIATKGMYREKEAAVYVNHLLRGITYLHENNIVHRDLKPENLLFEDRSENAFLKIADFGLGKILQNNVMLNTFCGTPGYIAPEVLQKMEYSTSVDMWSIGVIIYILLCGSEPFHASTDAEMFKKMLKCDYTLDGPAWSDISNNAKDLVERLLVLDPTKRLNAKRALSHPWVTGMATKSIPLVSTQSSIQMLNAKRRKLKVPAMAVHAFTHRKLSVMAAEVTFSTHADLNLSTISSTTDTESQLPSFSSSGVV